MPFRGRKTETRKPPRGRRGPGSTISMLKRSAFPAIPATLQARQHDRSRSSSHSRRDEQELAGVGGGTSTDDGLTRTPRFQQAPDPKPALILHSQGAAVEGVLSFGFHPQREYTFILLVVESPVAHREALCGVAQYTEVRNQDLTAPPGPVSYTHLTLPTN